jgi:hypothetical protein
MTYLEEKRIANLELMAIQKGSESVEFTTLMNETKRILQPKRTIFDEEESILIDKVQALTAQGKTIKEAVDLLGSNLNQYYKSVNK